jgi:hypothetical protein
MPSHDIRAQALDTPISAQKARLIVDVVRGKTLYRQCLLKFMPNYAAKLVKIARHGCQLEENLASARDLLYRYSEATTRTGALGGHALARLVTLNRHPA